MEIVLNKDQTKVLKRLFTKFSFIWFSIEQDEETQSVWVKLDPINIRIDTDGTVTIVNKEPAV